MRKTKKETREESYRNWLEETARGKRDTVKPDCQILMDYLDEIGLQYEHKPAIMLKDRCKGYIPDLLFHHPAADVIVDFIRPNKYITWDYCKAKAADLEGDGYIYYIIMADQLVNSKGNGAQVFFEEIDGEITKLSQRN